MFFYIKNIVNGSQQFIESSLALPAGSFTSEVSAAEFHKLKNEKSLLLNYSKNSQRERELRIGATDPLAIRHMRQELRFSAAEMAALAAKGKALTTAQFKELEAYTQALRDLPTTLKTWPVVAEGDWPKKPAFL